MKQTIILLGVFLSSCASVPHRLYENPERYRCEIVVDTEWNKEYPVNTFEHVMRLGESYQSRYFGTEYKLVATEDPEIFVIEVTIE